MSALNWLARVTALDAAIAAGASGTDLVIATSLRANLNAQGPPYTTAFTPEVDASKAAGIAATASALADWTTATTLAHVQADRCARYAGIAGSALAFNATSGAAVLARVDAAAALAITAATAALLVAHRAAVLGAYAARPGPQFGGSYAESRMSAATTIYVMKAGKRVRVEAPPAPLPSVMHMEEVLAPLLAQVDALLAELAFT